MQNIAFCKSTKQQIENPLEKTTGFSGSQLVCSTNTEFRITNRSICSKCFSGGPYQTILLRTGSNSKLCNGLGFSKTYKTFNRAKHIVNAKHKNKELNPAKKFATIHNKCTRLFRRNVHLRLG